MPTLQEITLAHSQRLSEIYRTRDVRLAQAQSLRDVQLRAVSGTAKVYEKYDDELTGARDKQAATESKAEAARAAALATAVDARSDGFEDAQIARRAADTEVVAAKRRAEDAANRKYESAIAGLRDLPPAGRDQAAQQAERARRTELEAARRTHDEALATAQKNYRLAVDEALIAERRESRDAERAYLEALRLSDAALRGAKAVADQDLAAALARIPEAAAVLRSWRAELATIASDTAQAEKDAFAWFRQELERLRV